MCNSVVVLLHPDFPPLMNQRKTVSLSSKTHGLIMTTSLLVPVMVPQSFGSQDHVDRMEKGGRWQKAYHLKVPPPPMPPQPPRGSPRQRNIPTPRGVNMIFWSLDNCFVLVAIMDMMYLYYICYAATITAGHPTMELVGLGMLDIPSLIHAYTYQTT